MPTLGRVLRLHALTPWLASVLIGGAALGMLLLLAVSVGVAYAAFVRPARLARATRYFVTDARVLIRRGNEELSLDRSRIAYVIDAPWRKLHDSVFSSSILPSGARALAPSGAFWRRGPRRRLTPGLRGHRGRRHRGQAAPAERTSLREESGLGRVLE